MQFTMVVSNKQRVPWDEYYDMPEFKDEQECKAYADKIVKEYNLTLRPGELPRQLIEIKDFKESDPGEPDDDDDEVYDEDEEDDWDEEDDY